MDGATTNAELGEPSPARDPTTVEVAVQATTDAMISRLRTRVGGLLRHVDRQAHYLLDRELTPEEVTSAALAGQGLAVLFGRIGLPHLSRLSRNVVSAMTDGNDRLPSTAIELATTCEDMRSLLDSAIAQHKSTSAPNGLVVVIGEPTEELDAVCWVAHARGHGVVQADQLPDVEAEPVGVIVVVEGDADTPTRNQLLAVNKRWRCPLIVLERGTPPATLRRITRYATTVLPLRAPPGEIVDELARVKAANALELRALICGDLPEVEQQRLTSYGFSLTAVEDGDALPRSVGTTPGAVVLGPGFGPLDASEVSGLVRVDPTARHNPIVWMTDLVEPDIAPHLEVSVHRELDDATISRLAAALRRRALASIDVGYVENVILDWGAAQVLIDRILAAAHRTGRQVAVATIRLEPSLPADRVADVEEVFGNEFRIEDTIGRREDDTIVLALAGVPRQVAVRRLAALLTRLELDDGDARVGVAVFPSDGRSAVDLVEAADDARERAADHGGPGLVATSWRPQVDEVDVLVVDSDPVMSQVLVDLIESSGMRAKSASTGPQALAALQADVDRVTPRLLLLDLDVRGIDGLVMLRELRTTGLLPQIKVLVMMARFSEPDQRMALDIGAADVINKPLSATLLLHRIRLLLGDDR